MNIIYSEWKIKEVIIIKNKYEIVGDKVKIHFKNKKLGDLHTLVSLECLDSLLKRNCSWFGMVRTNNRIYVVSTNYLGIIEGKPKYKTVYLHRYLMGCENTFDYVDHINHNTLDNTLENLRIVDNKENLKNRPAANRNNSTGIKNVTHRDGKYVVQLTIEGKNKWIDSFDNLEEASKCAEESRKKYYINK